MSLRAFVKSRKKKNEAPDQVKIRHEETLARRLVPEGTVNREAKIAARVRGDSDSPDVDRKESATVVIKLLEKFCDEIRYDLTMASNYRKFLLWLIYAIMLLCVISLQRKVNDLQVRFQYISLRDTYFNYGTAVTRDTSEDTSDSTRDFTAVQAHLEDVVLPAVFSDDQCGNGQCEAAWGEYPLWTPANDAKSFQGCASDCGFAQTRPVTVVFFDTYKLQNAIAAIKDLAEAGISLSGRTPEQWGAIGSDGSLVIEPRGGWNICHKTDAEEGWNEKVCVFQPGDININGLPYRTAELDPSSSLFANNKTLNLYPGDWELRIAFDGFVWTDELSGDQVNVGFPAIRGALCYSDIDDGNDCEFFGPCPQADDCECEFINNEYVCYDDEYWANFNTAIMRHTSPTGISTFDDDPSLAAYPKAYSLSTIADWWGIPRSPNAHGTDTSRYLTQREPPTNHFIQNSSSWSSECDTYTILLLDPALSENWDFDVILEIWAVDNKYDEISASSSQYELNAAKSYLVYEIYMEEADAGCDDSHNLILCRDRNYIFGFRDWTPGSPEERFTQGESLAYALVEESTSEVIFRGNAAWTYQKVLQGANGTIIDQLPSSTCPGDRYQDSCFDVNASNCFWNYNSVPKGTYCDPTLSHYGIYDTEEQSKDVTRNFFGLAGYQSGSFCPSVATCTRYVATYQGSSDGYYCDPSSTADLVDLFDSVNIDVSTNDESSSESLDQTYPISDSDIILEPPNLVPEAKHVACTFTDAICDSWFGNWRSGFGLVPTVGTGPGIDGDQAPYNFFAYIESSGVTNSSFFLQSENFTEPLDDIALLTFRYHMYGVRTGLLAVQALQVGMNLTATDLDLTSTLADDDVIESIWTPLWYQQFNQGSFWYDASITLPVNTLAIRFLAFADHESSDIAIDEVLVSLHPNATNQIVDDDLIPSSTITCLDFVLSNLAGSGWSGSVYRIEGNGISHLGFLSAISPEYETICFNPGCYDLSTDAGFDQEDYKFIEVAVSPSPGSYTVIRPRKLGFTTQISIDDTGNAYEDSCTQAPTVSPAPTLTPAPTCAATILIEQFDSFGDGWNGAVYSISRHGQVLSTGTLNDGTTEIDDECLPDTGCYNITVSSGLRPHEISFGIRLPASDGSNLIDSNNIPFSGSFYIDPERSKSFGSNESCGPSAEAPPKYEFVTTHSPTSAPRASIRCYSNWRRVRTDSPEEYLTTPYTSLSAIEDDNYLSETDLSSLEPNFFWEELPMSTIVECPNNEIGCVGIEFTWPPLEIAEYFSEYELRNEPYTYIGRGGCASAFPEVTSGIYESCYHYDSGFLRFSPPSLCFTCEGDLCNLRDTQIDANSLSPLGYTNVFQVPHVALYHSMEKAISSTSATAQVEFLSPSKLDQVCDTGAIGNDICDVDLNILGCGYDLGDCIDSPLTGNTVPWFQSPNDAWLYGFYTDSEVYATVPHTLHSAVKDKLKLHVLGNPDAFDSNEEWLLGNNTDLSYLLKRYAVNTLEELLHVLLPSLACPECLNYNGNYRAINFTVEATEASNTSYENAALMFAEPSSNEFRVRYLSQPNIVLYGIMLTQKRKESRNCPTNQQLHRSSFVDDLQQNLAGVCSTTQAKLTKASRTASSIVDTYEDAVHLNKVPFGIDATFDPSSSLYRQENVATDFYSRDKIRPSGIPYGFDHRMGATVTEKAQGKIYPRDFPVIFDVQANATRAQQIYQSIIDGGYFDSGTSSVTVSILVFNPETENFGLIESVYTNLPTGSVSADHSIDVYDIQYYATAFDYFRLFLEIIFSCLLTFLLSVELNEMYQCYKNTGSIIGYFLDFSNFVDIFGYIFQLLIIPVWIHINRLLFNFRPEATYNVHDKLATGRILKAGPETHEAEAILNEFRNISDSFNTYDLLCTFALVGLAVQSLKSLRFHPTFGLVSATIVAMSMRVLFWLFLLILVLSSYATLGTLLFGTDDPNYATFEASTVTLLAAMSGMYDYTGLSLDDVQAQFFLWTWMFIAFFVLLNVLLAIIVEGYEASRGLSLRRDPLLFFVKATFGLTDAEDCLISGKLLLKILERVMHVLQNMPDLQDDGLDDTVHLELHKEKNNPTSQTDNDDVEGGNVSTESQLLEQQKDEQRRASAISSVIRQFVTQTLSVVSSRFRDSRGPLSYDALVEWFEKNPYIKRAVARYRERDPEHYLLGPDELRRSAFEWKAADDEELITIDMALIYIAIRIVTPVATSEISMVWHLVALNLITRFGSDQSYGDAREDDEDGAKQDINRIAYQRLIEVHRLVELTEISSDPNIDCAALFAACYNYLQGRPESLRTYCIERVSEAQNLLNTPADAPENSVYHAFVSEKESRASIVRQIRDTLIAAENDELDLDTISELQNKLHSLTAKADSPFGDSGYHASISPEIELSNTEDEVEVEFAPAKGN